MGRHSTVSAPALPTRPVLQRPAALAANADMNALSPAALHRARHLLIALPLLGAAATMAAEPPAAPPPDGAAPAAPVTPGTPATTPAAPADPADPAPADGAQPPADGSAPAALDPATVVSAPPPDPEAELRAAHAAGQLPADVVVLGGEPGFLARYAPAEADTPRGALLVLPAQAARVTADALVDAAMRAHAASPWAVLAPQLPLLPDTVERAAYADTSDTAIARLRTALAWLTKEGYTSVVMVGADDSAALVNAALAAGASDGVRAVALLGRWEGALDQLTLPVLELHAEGDAAAHRLALARKAAARKSSKADYELATLDALGAARPGFEADAARRVRGWAERVLGSGNAAVADAPAAAAAGAPASPATAPAAAPAATPPAS